jgi:hypothetical protein
MLFAGKIDAAGTFRALCWPRGVPFKFVHRNLSEVRVVSLAEVRGRLTSYCTPRAPDWFTKWEEARGGRRAEARGGKARGGRRAEARGGKARGGKARGGRRVPSESSSE